jgi:hypothetical protein
LNTDSFDINGFAATTPKKLVADIDAVLSEMLLPVKLSQQKGKEHKLVFDPIAANVFIIEKLNAKGWQKIDIPEEWSALGVDIDFGKQGVWGEAQFSNYPFFINNIVRASVIHKKGAVLPPMGKVDSVVIVTKCGMFDSANSSLYYEQAVEQLKFLDSEKMIPVPVRIVGLSVPREEKVKAVLTAYEGRTSRTVKSQTAIWCRIGADGHVIKKVT